MFSEHNKQKLTSGQPVAATIFASIWQTVNINAFQYSCVDSWDKRGDPNFEKDIM